MLENQIMLANELRNMKAQLEQKNAMLGSNYNVNTNELIMQLNQLNGELQQYKQANNLLSTQLEELKLKMGSSGDMEKLQLLEQKKEEIRAELGKIREEHVKTEAITKKQEMMDVIIDRKKEEVMLAINKYDFKIFGGEHDFLIEYTDLKKVDSANKPIYRYTLPYAMDNVTHITLVAQNFNKNIFNISPYNNKMIIADIGEYDVTIDKIDDISYKCLKNNMNRYMLEIMIEPGNYEIDILIAKLNLVLNKYEIEIGYDPTKYIVQIRSKKDHAFTLIEDPADIYAILGLQVTDTKNAKFRGNNFKKWWNKHIT